MVRAHARLANVLLPHPSDYPAYVQNYEKLRRWAMFEMWFGGSSHIREGFLVRELKSAAEDLKIVSLAKLDSRLLEGAKRSNVMLPSLKSSSSVSQQDDDWNSFESWIAAGPTINYVTHHISVVNAKPLQSVIESTGGLPRTYEQSGASIAIDEFTHQQVSQALTKSLHSAAEATIKLGEAIGIPGAQHAAENIAMNVAKDLQHWHNKANYNINELDLSSRDSISAVQSLVAGLQERRATRISHRRASKLDAAVLARSNRAVNHSMERLEEMRSVLRVVCESSAQHASCGENVAKMKRTMDLIIKKECTSITSSAKEKFDCGQRKAAEDYGATLRMAEVIKNENLVHAQQCEHEAMALAASKYDSELKKGGGKRAERRLDSERKRAIQMAHDDRARTEENAELSYKSAKADADELHEKSIRLVQTSS